MLVATLLLAHATCAVHGRRLQALSERMQGVDDALKSFATLLLRSDQSAAWQSALRNPSVKTAGSAATPLVSSSPFPTLDQHIGARVSVPHAQATVERESGIDDFSRHLKQRPKKAPAPVTFPELGVKSKVLLRSLERMGFEKPMEMQNLAFTPIRDTDRDVGMIAEAGSGKTLSYLLPLIDRLMLKQKQSKDGHHVVHIVVPTHDLAEQAMRVAKDLCQTLPLKLAFADSREASSADLIVGTTGASALFLTGSTDGKVSAKGKLTATKAHKKGRKPVQAKSKQAASTDSDSAPTHQPYASKNVFVTLVLDEADLQLSGAKGFAGRSGGGIATKILEVLRPSKHEEKLANHTAAGTPSARVIIVSATMPADKGSPGQYLERRIQNIQWLQTKGAHKPLDTLQSEFKVYTDDEERDKQMLHLIDERKGRTIIFTHSSSKANEIHRQLQDILPKSALFLFHPKVKPHERDDLIRRFSARENKPVMVCSGLAGRGIDIPDVQLVIEHEIAPNIVDHVHRIGRTARAGKSGHSVSFVKEGRKADEYIVQEIERCQKGGWKFL